MRGHATARESIGTFLPDVRATRANIGAWAQLSVVQYFVAESAVIEAWAGPEPYSRATGFISDLGARNLAMGYLALIIPDPPRSATPFECGGGSLIGGCVASGEQLGY